jgi:hypothetical protein
VVDELQMSLEVVEEFIGDGVLGPKEGEVVGEGSEKDTQEEAGG